jgi:hypothetical protein
MRILFFIRNADVLGNSEGQRKLHARRYASRQSPVPG